MRWRCLASVGVIRPRTPHSWRRDEHRLQRLHLLTDALGSDQGGGHRRVAGQRRSQHGRHARANGHRPRPGSRFFSAWTPASSSCSDLCRFCLPGVGFRTRLPGSSFRTPGESYANRFKTKKSTGFHFRTWTATVAVTFFRVSPTTSTTSRRPCSRQ